MLTIGELAKRVGVATSTLRFYEKDGLIAPDGRSDSGYRLYHPEQEKRLRFIQRAQRLGFSLNDIKVLLNGLDNEVLSSEVVIETARRRYHELDRQLTSLLVLQHELGLFLQDLAAGDYGRFLNTNTTLHQFIDHICNNPIAQPPSQSMLTWLAENTGCLLTSTDGQAILNKLRGKHVHIWQEGSDYHILIVSQDKDVLHALQALSQLETTCTIHDHPIPELNHEEDGFRFTARGENAFIFARLFMALEQEAEGSNNNQQISS
ncbi:MAG: hypothetical protein Kow0080_08170 [Candidatus Promineifilaceae bacterium]